MKLPKAAGLWFVVIGFVPGFLAGQWIQSSPRADSSGGAAKLGSRPTQVAAPLDPAFPSAGQASLGSQRAPGTVTVNERLTVLLGELDGQKRRAALRALGAELGASQPVEGWKLLAVITGLADRQDFAEALIGTWAHQDPAAALAACAGLSAGELQATSTSAAIGAWAESSPTEALRWATEHLTGSVREMAVSAAASRWAVVDSASAAAWALENAESSSGIAGIREIMGYWADMDPEAGARWATALPAGLFRSAALESVIQRWADQFPQEAASWVSGQSGAGELMQIVAATWASSEPEDAASWAGSLRNPAIRQRALEETVAAWAAAAPEQALHWASREANPQTRLVLEQTALEGWAADDPVAAVTWAERNPRHADATTAIFNTWAANSPSTLDRWIETRQPAARPDAALEAISIALAESAPDRAMVKAMAIRDSVTKFDTVLRVYGQWEDVNAAAAAAWLARNPAMAPHLARSNR